VESTVCDVWWRWPSNVAPAKGARVGHRCRQQLGMGRSHDCEAVAGVECRQDTLDRGAGAVAEGQVIEPWGRQGGVFGLLARLSSSVGTGNRTETPPRPDRRRKEAWYSWPRPERRARQSCPAALPPTRLRSRRWHRRIRHSVPETRRLAPVAVVAPTGNEGWSYTCRASFTAMGTCPRYRRNPSASGSNPRDV
jgi:hypothetical protein